MKKAILSVFVVLMTSCGVLKFYSGSYDISLKDVNGSIGGDNINGLKFSDDVIDVTWRFLSKSLNFDMKNKTGSPIKIIWDDVIYVDVDGVSKKTMHSGVKYIDAHDSQPPTTIVGGSRIEDLIMPSDNVKYKGGYGWDESDLLLTISENRYIMESTGNRLVGSKIKVLMPIEIDGKVNNYTFTFSIDNFKMDD